MLPGNQRGLSGSAATHTVVALRAVGVVLYLLTLNLLPPRNEAFVVPTIDPFLLELQQTISNYLSYFLYSDSIYMIMFNGKWSENYFNFWSKLLLQYQIL